MSNNISNKSTVEPLPLLGGHYFNTDKIRRSASTVFDSKQEYGLSSEMQSKADKGTIQFLHNSARKILPKGTPYELRMAEDCSVAAWYYSPIVEIKPPMTKWRFKKSCGVYFMGPFYS